MLMSSAKNHVGLERTFGKHPAAIGVVSVTISSPFGCNYVTGESGDYQSAHHR